MNELMVKQPSENLKHLIDQAVRTFHTSAELAKQVFKTGRSEGFSDKQIGRMIRDRMLSLGYDQRTIRRALPQSAKDLTKTRKDYLPGVQSDDDDSAKLDEDIMSSYENRSESNENQTSRSATKECTLENQLKQEQSKYGDLQNKYGDLQNKYGDLSIRHENASATVSTLILAKEKFPSNSGEVFNSQDHVFVVEFKGIRVLDISVMTQQQAHDQCMNEGQITKVS